eukprot:CAMPEP_0116573332 /NCGR_PEP_ID=MMETSP0397-20121206/18724_1 /TAXON_ID=216820 /ORGANISM="Cyclophora tenuis, Strain ECT3854" /LENGTH=194 /DNA_ID=CAMNT_0004101863 /DNA_START=56 /DNA_END=641 /DNA_ORIENTATION=+
MAFVDAIRSNETLTSISLRDIREFNLMDSDRVQDDEARAGLDQEFFDMMRQAILSRHDLRTDMVGSSEIRFYRYLNEVGFWKLVHQDDSIGVMALAIANLYRQKEWDEGLPRPNHPEEGPREQWDLDCVFFLLKHRLEVFSAAPSKSAGRNYNNQYGRAGVAAITTTATTPQRFLGRSSRWGPSLSRRGAQPGK